MPERNGHRLIRLDGGVFTMGSDDDEGYPGDGEAPARRVEVAPFAIDACAVTNAQFSAFIGATGHTTEAERFGWSFVFAGLLPDDFPPTRGVVGAEWWRQVNGATWQHPEGPESDISTRADHPVVHVSFNDAQAYCAWAELRLPTEAEWEFAARGGLAQKRYPWGDQLVVDGRHRCNVWQGEFPRTNTVDDGYYGTAPADAFPPNDFGLYNAVGNVWEWCDSWFNPTARVMRGGSYLCHDSYCNRYRVAARSSNAPDSTTGNLGFRCAR